MTRFESIISTIRKIKTEAERIVSKPEGTVVSSLEFEGMADQEALEATLAKAARQEQAIVDLGGQSYVVSRTPNYIAPEQKKITFTNGTIFRSAGLNIANLQLARCGAAVFTSSFVLDGNNRAEPPDNRMRSPALVIHNVQDFHFSGRVEDSTSYAIKLFQQGAQARETRSYVVEDATFENCWEGGIDIANVGVDGCDYRFSRNSMTLNIHPNGAAFPIQGPNGFGFEVEDLPDIGSVKTIGKIVVEDNDIAINGSMMSNAYGIMLINAPNVPGLLNIRETHINRNKVYPLEGCQKIAIPIFWLSPWLYDRGTPETCIVDISNNDLEGKLSSALVLAKRGDNIFSNTRFNLTMDRNIDRGGLASSTIKPFQREGVWS